MEPVTIEAGTAIKRRNRWIAAGVTAVAVSAVTALAVFSGTDEGAVPVAAAVTTAAVAQAAPVDGCEIRDGGFTVNDVPVEAVCVGTIPESTSTTDTPATSTTVAPTTVPAATSTSAPSTTSPATTTSAPSPTSTTVTTSTTTPATTVPSGSGFTENFATAAGVNRFDFQLRTYGPSIVDGKFRGEHDTSCGPPQTYRDIDGGQQTNGFMDVSATGLVYRCGGPGSVVADPHMMTALSTSGIAIMAFSPKQTFTNVKQVCWDQNMNDLGGGKWANVLVVSASDVAARGGNLTYTAKLADGIGDPQFRQLPPASAVDFTWLTGTVYLQGQEIAWKSYVPGGMDALPNARYQICLGNSPAETSPKTRPACNGIRIERPDQTIDCYPRAISFPSGAVKVIWQDASYDPAKHGGSADHLTWHFDNVTIRVG